MAELEPHQARRLSADNQTISKSEIPLKERFFRYFQHEITGRSRYSMDSNRLLSYSKGNTNG